VRPNWAGKTGAEHAKQDVVVTSGNVAVQTQTVSDTGSWSMEADEPTDGWC